MPTLQSAYSMPNFGIDSKGIQALSHESDYDEAEPSLDENPSSKFSTHPDEHPSKSALIGSAHNDGSHYSAVGSSSKVPASEAPFDGVLKRFRARELAEAIKSRSLSEVKTGNNPSQHTLGEGRPLRNKGDEFSALVPFHRMPDGSVARNPGPEVLAWLPRNGPPKLEELISRLPFAEKCSLSKPSDHGIVKICGVSEDSQSNPEPDSNVIRCPGRPQRRSYSPHLVRTHLWRLLHLNRRSSWSTS